MKCKKCGYEFHEGIFCPECGTPLDETVIKRSKKEIEKQEAIEKDQRELELAKAKANQERLALERTEREIELTRLNNEKIRLEQEQAQKKAEEDKIRTEQLSRTFNGIIYSSVEEMEAAKKNYEKETEEKNQRKKVNSQALWCLILSIASIPLGITGIGLIVAIIVSVVLGIIALKRRTEKKGFAIAGLIIDALVIIVMVVTLIWAFSDDDSLSERNDAIEEAENDNDSEESSLNPNSEMIDLYDVRLLSETELISEYGFKKNDFSMYPDESNMAIYYDSNGNITIVIAGDNKENYEFYGLKIGDDISSIDPLISKKFTYCGEYIINDSKFLIYRDNKNENGYLRIEVSSKIISINYFISYEDLSDLIGESTDEQAEVVNDDYESDALSTIPYEKDISGEYEMLIGQSFIYASIQWVSIQHDDYLYISIEGVDETGKEYFVDGYLFESEGKYDCYFCNGNLKFMINVSGDNLDITTEDDPESYNREEKPIAYLFSGTYYKSNSDVVGGSNDVYVIVAAPDGYVNFRTGPGTNYDIIMPIYNGEELWVIGEEAGTNWIQVKYLLDSGYITGWVNKTQVRY